MANTFKAFWKCSTCGGTITEPAYNFSTMPDTLHTVASFMLKSQPVRFHECSEKQVSIAYLASVLEVESADHDQS